jgi:hypothetical protein
MMTRTLRAFAIAASICAATAQPIPKLKSISQEYVQRGSTLEITIMGENLSNAKFLIAGDPGLQLKLPAAAEAAIAIEATGGGISAVTKSDPNKMVLTLDVAGTSALGRREIRAASGAGVSNPLNLTVTHLLEHIGAPGANSIAKAQEMALPFAVTTKINAAAESDYYRFKANKGEHVVLEVVAQRLGSALDSSLAVLNKEGRELARNEDAVGNDSVLEFVAPEDGEYIAQVRDYRLQGGDNFQYRLLAGALPYVKAAFPFAGRRGEITEIELRGYNLQGAEKMTLRLNPDARLGQQDLRTSSAIGLSNPFAFIVSDLPEIMESEPNSSLTHANQIALPSAMNGRIQNAKDYDAFKFHVEKDQRWVFEVAAQRFGSPLDALLTLTDDRGNVVQKNDDSNGPDARLDQTFSGAGDYILIIEDLLEHGGPDFTYRITATQSLPDFEVKLVNDTARVPRGGRVPVRCELSRANNFNGPVRIFAKGLAAGLHAEPLVLTANDPGAGLLFISASTDAPLDSTPLFLEATAVVNGKNVTHRVGTFSGDRAVKAAYVTVIDQAPFLIHSGNLLATVEQDQSMNIETLVERRDGFDGEIKISLEGFSAGREPVTRSFDYQPITIKGNESHGTISAKAKLDSEIGARMMALRGDATVNGQNITQYSAPFPVATTEIPFMLTTTLKRVVVTAVPPGSQSSANEAVFQVKANRRAGFNDEIALKLEGVPGGISATLDKIPGNAAEATVKLIASEKVMPTTNEIQLNLTGVGTFKDKTYRFKPPAIALQVNAPEPVEVKTAEVKPAPETAATTAVK